MSIFPVLAELDRAGRMSRALEEIKKLHAPVDVCAGCHLRECPGDCDWNDAEQGVIVCGICCWDDRDNARSQDCIDSHEHTAEGPVCSTTEIIARAGL